jgi:hypothetical protein
MTWGLASTAGWEGGTRDPQRRLLTGTITAHAFSAWQHAWQPGSWSA